VYRLAKVKLALAMVIFGTIGIIVRLISLPSSIIALARGLLGAIFLLLYMIFSKSKLSLEEIKSNFILLALSGAAIGINWILLFEAYRFTTVATATLCYYFAPVFVIALSPFLLGEKLNLSRLLCVIAAVVGMVFISGIFDGGLEGGNNLKGIIFGMAAAAFYASVVLINKFIKNISPVKTTILQLSMATAVLLPYVLLKEDISAITIEFNDLILLLLVGAVHTGLAYYLYFSSMKDLKGQTIAFFSYLDPLVAIMLSALLLNESLGLYNVIGAILILGSTFVSEASS